MLDKKDNDAWIRHNFRKKFTPFLGAFAGVFLWKFSGNKRYVIPAACGSIYVCNTSAHKCSSLQDKYVGLKTLSDQDLWRLDKDHELKELTIKARTAWERQMREQFGDKKFEEA